MVSVLGTSMAQSERARVKEITEVYVCPSQFPRLSPPTSIMHVEHLQCIGSCLAFFHIHELMETLSDSMTQVLSSSHFITKDPTGQKATGSFLQGGEVSRDRAQAVWGMVPDNSTLDCLSSGSCLLTLNVSVPSLPGHPSPCPPGPEGQQNGGEGVGLVA